MRSWRSGRWAGQGAAKQEQVGRAFGGVLGEKPGAGHKREAGPPSASCQGHNAGAVGVALGETRAAGLAGGGGGVHVRGACKHARCSWA